ncbi:unnamed protein product, partial [Prorocentrum cordatum]
HGEPSPPMSRIYRQEGRYLPAPPDGLCLTYCAIAARNTFDWVRDRGQGGFRRNHAQAWQDNAEAKVVREMVMRAMGDEGLAAEVVRLRQAGAAGYPGEDELRIYAKVLNGQIEIKDPVGHLRIQGSAGPDDVIDEDMLAIWADTIGGRVEKLPSTADSATLLPMIVLGDRAPPRLYRVMFEMHEGSGGVEVPRWILSGSHMQPQGLHQNTRSPQPCSAARTSLKPPLDMGAASSGHDSRDGSIRKRSRWGELGDGGADDVDADAEGGPVARERDQARDGHQAQGTHESKGAPRNGADFEWPIDPGGALHDGVLLRENDAALTAEHATVQVQRARNPAPAQTGNARAERLQSHAWGGAKPTRTRSSWKRRVGAGDGKPCDYDADDRPGERARVQTHRGESHCMFCDGEVLRSRDSAQNGREITVALARPIQRGSPHLSEDALAIMEAELGPEKKDRHKKNAENALRPPGRNARREGRAIRFDDECIRGMMSAAAGAPLVPGEELSTGLRALQELTGPALVESPVTFTGVSNKSLTALLRGADEEIK